MSTKLVVAVTDDDGSVRSATVNEQRTLTSARAKARGRLHVSPVFPNRSSIALYLLSLPLPLSYYFFHQRMNRRFPM
jgi:hypothetical protein